MSGTPVHMVAAAADGKPYGRRAVWQAVRELHVFTAMDVRLRIPHVKGSLVDDYLALLVRGGFVERGPMVKGMGLGCGKVRQFTLLRDVGVEAPRLKKDGSPVPPTAQQHMWLAMKILGTFTVQDLLSSAATDHVPVHLHSAELYVSHLHTAGYLVKINAQAYMLVNNTGGLAPMIQRTKCVFDPNLNKIMWHEDIEP